MFATPLPAPACDPRLVDQIGADDLLKLDALPVRSAGAVTLVHAPANPRSEADLARLRSRFGPVAVAETSRKDMDAHFTELIGPVLAHQAEARPSAQESCRDWSSSRAALVVALACAVLAALVALAPEALMIGLVLWTVFALIAVTGLRTAAALTELRARKDEPPCRQAQRSEALPIISVLVPLFQEKDIAARLVRRLRDLDYPRDKLDLILILEDDDALTLDTLAKTELPDWMRVLPVPRGTIRTKPRALNYALDFAKGEIVGVYDAEDWPSADQLQAVAAAFAAAAPDVACLQGALTFYNARQNWLTRCFTIDYATWFGLILPGLARLRLVVPLGGTTLFFHADVLRRLGYWDAHNVTEDADLGVRLARHGYRTEFLNSTTQEEATTTLPTWIKQRSRWIKGYAVTWAVHMRDPLRLWAELGTLRFLAVQVLFLGTLSLFLLAPLLWSFWLVVLGFDHPFTSIAAPWLVWTVTVLFFAAEILTVGINALAVTRPKDRWLIPWVPVMHLYFPLAAIACWKGLSQLITRPFYWDKTQHGRFDVRGAPEAV